MKRYGNNFSFYAMWKHVCSKDDEESSDDDTDGYGDDHNEELIIVLATPNVYVSRMFI